MSLFSHVDDGPRAVASAAPALRKGLWIPIIVNPQGVILDGHHRYRICKKHNIPLITVIREFSNKVDEAVFVGESNMKRRQLSDIEKIQLIIKLEPYYKEQARLRMSEGGRGANIVTPSKTRDDLGKKANVSGTQFEKGKKILQNAPTEIINKIKSGGTTINKEYQKLQKEEKREQRQQEIQKTQVNHRIRNQLDRRS